MKLELNKNIEVGDYVYWEDTVNEDYLVCEISSEKYGVYMADKYDGLGWLYKDECKLSKKAIYIEENYERNE